jgi:hypothetical protein
MTEKQLTFEEIFAAGERERATQHLPGDFETAVPFYRGLIEQFHAALLIPDYEAAEKIQKEADDLAAKLNGGTTLGIKGDPDAPCYVLERATAAEPGSVPLWGQTGEFIVTVGTVKVRIEIEGMYGIGAMPIPGFSAHCVDPAKPFISETGYRSFLGYQPEMPPGMTPDQCVTEIIKVYMAREMKRGPVPVQPEYRERFEAPAP